MKISTRIKVLLFSFFVFCMLGVSAQVVITRPSGGQNISVERSVGGPLEQFTAIGDIAITDQSATDFTSGTDRRFRFNAPTGWDFEVGTATVSHNGTRVIAASVFESTARYIVISYDANSTAVTGNSITISGLRVKSTSRAVTTAANVVRASAGTNDVTIAGLANNTIIATLSKVTGTYVGLQVLLPGQINSPGSTTGKGGTIVSQVAGATFPITVNAVDYAFNIVTSAPNHTVSLTSTNPYFNVIGTQNLSSGTALFNVSMNTARSTTVTATNVTDGSINQNTSSNITILAGTFVKLLTVFPNETYAPGSPTGKTGTASAPQYGINYVSTIYAVDEFWNKATAPNPTSVQFNVTGVTNATIPVANNLSTSGSTINSRPFNLVFRTLGEIPNVTATNNTDGTKTAYSQVLPAVTTGPFTKLQILLPGETATPGVSPGKTGTPLPQAAGVSFDVIVNAVDANWNLISSITDVVGITNGLTTDAATSLLPANAALVNGTGTFSVTLRRASLQTLKASDVTDATKTANTSPNITVAAGVFAKLLITLSNETHLPGTAAGKGNITTTIAANATTTATVRTVDAYWNMVTSQMGATIQLTSSDVNATVLTDKTIGATGTAVFSNFRFRTAGNQTITASNGNVAQNYTTDPINVTAGVFNKLVLIMPGEAAVEGNGAGKTGAPDPQVAGQSFPIIVKAADTYGNTVTTATNSVSFSGDTYAQLPPNTSLINGILNATAIYRVAGVNKTLTVMDIAASRSYRSPSFIVNVGPYAGLLITFTTGQTYAAGSPNGNLNPIPNQGINTPFNIVVRAVDAAYNVVTSVNDNVQITSNDFSGVMPATALLTNGVSPSLSVRLNSASTATTLTSTSVQDATKNYTTGFITVLGPSATTDYFRSVVLTGVWANSSSWESSATGNVGTWQASTGVPGTAAKGITVRNGHTITINASVSLDDVVVENGAQVNLTGGNLTVADNAAVVEDFLVQGVFRQSGGTILGAGTFQIANGGKYQHNYNSATTIPTLNWAVGSTCEIIGYTTYAGDVTGSNQTFSNFVWNASNQTAVGSPSLLASFTARDFTVTSTGAGSLNLGSVGGTTIITRDYTQTAGTVRANKTSGTQNLSFGRDFSVNGGNFALGNGTVNLDFNGSNQDLTNSGSAIEFQNVTFSNAGTKKLVSGNFSLATTGVLTMAGTSTLNANGNLTILSDASSSGTIAAIPSSSGITGNVRVQSYISGGAQNPYRTYRMISSPIYDNGNTANRTYSHLQFIDDLLITGNGGIGNGFDDSPFNNASAWVYTPGASPAFQDVTNINTSIDAGKSAYIYYRGNRSNPNDKFEAPYVDPENLIMDFEGVLNQQNVTVSLANNGNLVGNPYASSIDWNTGIIKTGLLGNTIRMWNPATRSYATYDGVTGVPSGVNNVIPAGQGFFVQTTSGGTLTFTEASKVNTQPAVRLMSTPSQGNIVVQKLAANKESLSGFSVPNTELRLTLSLDGSVYSEETAVVFQAGKSGAYNATEDASYIHNYSAQDGGQKVFLSSRSTDNRDLVINYMPEITASSSVNFNINTFNEAGNYQLKVAYKDVPSGYIVKLNDAFLSTSTTVQNGDLHAFNIDKTQAGSYGVNRFSVSFEAPTTLPVTYNTQFTVAKTNQGVLTRWSTATEVNNNRFEIRRAGDDKVYQKLHTELAKGSASAYSFIDKNPLLGNNYYKLVQFDNDGAYTETLPQVINYTGSINNNLELVSIFPNPIVSNFTVKFNGALKANQQILKVVNATGKILLTQNVSKPQLTAGHEINISGYPSGIYFVEVYENGAQRLGQMKLIKQ